MRLVHDRLGEGPPIVLLHGFPLDRSIWSQQLDSLAERHLVIAPDLRGHGESPAPKGVYSMEDLAGDVFETIDQAGATGPFVVAGLSMGGYVALAIAELAPERVKGLILINSRATADPPETRRVREDLALLTETQGTPREVVDTMASRLFSPSTREGRPELVASWRERMGRTSVAGVAGALRGMAARPDRSRILASLNVPGLVVAGEDDQLIPTDESRRMAEILRDGELRIIGGAGHLCPIENPEETTAALRHFLNRIN